MKHMYLPGADHPSLESLVEAGLIEIESLHPGGLDLTHELASLCNVGAGTRVLDVACGTGESACYLAERLGADVCGVDRSPSQIHRARGKAAARGLLVRFREGVAAALPFADDTFDVAICECTLCLLDKTAVLHEMVRVIRPGGVVGMHDLFWHDGAPEKLKRTLAEIEGEEPETLDGWRHFFAAAGLVDVRVADRTAAKLRWMRDSRRQLGARGYLRLLLRIIARWGIAGLWTVVRSERIFANRNLGYGIVVGTKP